MDLGQIQGQNSECLKGNQHTLLNFYVPWFNSLGGKKMLSDIRAELVGRMDE